MFQCKCTKPNSTLLGSLYHICKIMYLHRRHIYAIASRWTLSFSLGFLLLRFWWLCKSNQDIFMWLFVASQNPHFIWRDSTKKYPTSNPSASGLCCNKFWTPIFETPGKRTSYRKRGIDQQCCAEQFYVKTYILILDAYQPAKPTYGSHEKRVLGSEERELLPIA